MSLSSHLALKPAPRSPWRWLRFSLRTLLVAMTLVCVGIVAKQQYDWHRRQKLIHAWIAPLVELARAADGDVTRYPDDPPQLTPPAGLPAEEQIPLLRWGILNLEEPEERLAALKILVESHGVESVPVIRGLIPECDDDELKATLVHLLLFARDPSDLPLFERLLRSPAPVIRAAAAESIGYMKHPAYDISDQNGRVRLNTIPPITVPVEAFIEFERMLASEEGLPRWDYDNVPWAFHDRVEAIMLSGATSEERTAAARALIEWPPEKYSLRISEWGVWIDEGGQRLTTKGVLEEIPAFVHTTGNPLASLRINRGQRPMVITKPILHLTTDRPLAVDLEVAITQGRPWYAFPRPDTLTVDAKWGSADITPWEAMEAKELAPLPELSEGYPWIHPADRSGDLGYGLFISDRSPIDAVGLRWQSLIVSPERQSWMQQPAVPHDPKFRWWEDLRKVPSAWVTSQGETERFLYYDGPTTARSPLKATLDETALTIVARDLFGNVPFEPAFRKACLFVDTTHSPPQAIWIDPHTFSNEVRLVLSEQVWLIGRRDIERIFRSMLLKQGLTKEEAGGLLDAWRERFFAAPGQRLLTLLTRAEYDRMCPLKVRPPATETVRVGVVLREF